MAGLPRRLGIKVSADAAKALKSSKPDVVVLCTSSSIKKVLPQIETILKSKTPIVSTTEELAYPGYTHIRQARQIDTWAKKAKVAVLSTGVNPGFVMDALPIALTAVCARVDRVVVNRIQDARIRRLPFQQKIGAGLTTEQFQKQVADGSVRHVGFTESIAMIADALGWTLDRITDQVEPKLASVTTSSEFLAVDPGYVSGIIQDGIGYRKGEPAIRLHMEAYLGAPETYDSIEIDGSPRLHVRVAGGIHGDIATTSIVINSIPKVLDRRARAAHDARPAAAVVLPGPIDPVRSTLQILARCPTCDAGLPVRGDEEAAAIQCGGCGRDIPLKISEALRLDRAVDRCPVCDGADFYGRKDFDPKIGLTVVIVGALISGGVLLVRPRSHRVQHSRRRRADRSRRLRPAEGLDGLLPLPHRVPRRLPADGARVRPAHGGRPRAGVRAADRTDGESDNWVIGCIVTFFKSFGLLTW